MISNGRSPGRATAIPSAIVGRVATSRGLPAAIDANAPTVGRRTRLHGRSDAGEEAAAADSEHDRLEIGNLVVELDPERSLADDHVSVVEGVDEHGAGPLGVLGGQAQRSLDGGPFEHDVGAIATGGEELRDRHAQRHEDGRGDAQGLRRERDPLRMVARRGGDDTAFALLLAQARQTVGGTADLERPGALQVLELEMHRHAEQVGEELRAVRRGAGDHAVQGGGGIGEVFDGGGAHARVLLVLGTVVQIRSAVTRGSAPVSQARSPR